MDIIFKYIPMFLEADTKKDLVEAMLRRSMEDSHSYRFFDIQFVEGKWVAWYYPENDKIHGIGHSIQATGKVEASNG